MKLISAAFITLLSANAHAASDGPGIRGGAAIEKGQGRKLPVSLRLQEPHSHHSICECAS